MKEHKINHLLFMDDLKLLSKSEEQMDTLVRTVHILGLILGWSLEWKYVEFLPWREVIQLDVKLPNSKVMKEIKKESSIVI